MLLTIKLHYGDDIRRISLDDTKDNIVMSDLFSRIRSLFTELADVPSERLFINYKDCDGDTIRITNDMEYSEAISSVTDNGTKLLRLFIRNASNVETQLFVHEEHPSRTNHLNSMVNSLLSQLYSPPQPNATVTAETSSPSNDNGLLDVIKNIGATLPAEQLNPIVLALMQSPGVQQLIPQLMSTFFGGNMNSAKGAEISPLMTASTVNATSSTPTSPVLSSVATATLSCDTKDISIGTVTETSSVYTSTVVPSLTSVSTSTPLSGVGMVDATTQHETSLDSSTQVGQFAGSKFGSILQQLTELGFSDTSKNIAILVKNSGNIEKTIDDLVGNK